MVRLILGRAGSGKTARLLNLVKKRAESGKTGQIFLVPEQFSLNAERALCRVCGNGISLSAEVMTFKSLATRVFDELGGGIAAMLDDGGRLLTMYAAVSNIRSRLRVYGGAVLRPEFLQKLLALTDELKAYNVAPEDLLVLEGTGGALPDKLYDVACISGAYDALMTAELKDPADRMKALCRALDGSGYFRGRSVCVDGFNGFTGAELSVLSQIIQEADDLDIALCADGVTDEDRGAGVFSHVKKTVAALQKLCARLGVACETDTASIPCKRFARPDGDLAAVERGLFDYTCEPRAVETDGSVALYEAESLYTECEAAAARAKALIAQGLRLREIAVVTRDMESYGRTAEAVFRKYGLPVFLDQRSDAAQKLPVRLLCAALDIAANGCSLNRMLRLVKTGLAGVSPAEADELERYALMWNLNGAVWLAEPGFTANPAGYGAPMDDDARNALDHINELRRRAAAPLSRLIERSRGKTARQRAAALYAYAEELDLAGALEARARLLEAGNPRAGAEYVQLWELLCRCLDQCVLILGETALGDAEFAELFRLLVTQYNVGAIPTGADVIAIGDAARMRADHPRAVFVLGALDGVFPPKPAEGGILTQADRRKLEDDAGISLSPANEDRIAWEQLIAYQTLAAPSEFLWISWPKTGQPSYLVERVRAVLPRLATAGEADGGPVFKTYAQAPCEELAAAALHPSGGDVLARAALAVLRAGADSGDVLARAALAAEGRRGPLRAPDTVRKLYGPEPVLTASRVERFRTCRFAHFARYGLKARPDKKAAFEAAETGSFLHYVLEKTSKDIMEHGGFSIDRAELTAFIEASAARHIDEYTETYMGGLGDKPQRLRYTVERLGRTVREILCGMIDEFAASRFVPVGFETPLGADGAPLRFDAGGEPVLLSGCVDRIDLWAFEGVQYVRVVDYKSGAKAFTYKDVENGIGIQLLLYLFAVVAGDRAMRPAGVLYKPVGKRFVALRPGMTREDMENELRRSGKCKGVVLDDDGVILAMEAVPEGRRERFIPVAIDGGAIRRSRSSLVDQRQFGILKGHIVRLMRETKAALTGGAIECDPFAGACEFCDFHRLCRFDPTNGRDAFREAAPLRKDEFFARHAGDEMEV